MMKLTLTCLLATFSLFTFSAVSIAQDDAPKIEKTPSPEGARAYIIWPKDGKNVKSKFKVTFGLKGMGVAPAGIKLPNTGHHHLLVNHKEKIALDMPLPASDTLIHFGGGQTETTLELPPGKHTLQLVLGDFAHTPHHPPVMSDVITITVAAP